MVVVIEKLHVAYMPVPKAACSAVKALLAKVDPDVTLPESGEQDDLTYHAIYQTRRFRMDRFRRCDGYFRFTVVRDPIRRLLSAYTNRVVDLGDLRRSRRLRNRRPDLPVDPDPDFFFQNIDTYRHLSSSIHHHVMTAKNFTGTDLDLYDRVYRTGEIGALATELSARAGRAVVPVTANASSGSLAFDDLAPDTRDGLRAFLNGEYDHLSAYFDNPIA